MKQEAYNAATEQYNNLLKYLLHQDQMLKYSVIEIEDSLSQTTAAEISDETNRVFEVRGFFKCSIFGFGK